jgi:uncharacterized membrane protein
MEFVLDLFRECHAISMPSRSCMTAKIYTQLGGRVGIRLTAIMEVGINHDVTDEKAAVMSASAVPVRRGWRSAEVFWGATMVSTLGLIWALAGSSYGAVVFLAVWGVVVVARADSARAAVLAFAVAGAVFGIAMGLFVIAFYGADQARRRGAVL